ncbi:MAG TPA: DUF2330 domain-containing protein [Sandaracinaceae bacterium LLY-WYZ-13_1]|nr:DUF2330 domain-containing protein [Sandaracinaceae bacterium LLY-WYZ-13_1]
MTIRRTLGLSAAALAGALLAAPTPAEACGGFFCNRQAIDQSGENILFVYNDDGTVSTVVQIFYQGPSEEFAWILPVPAEPEVSVGTDALFQQLGAATRPRFTTTTVVEGECRSEPTCWDSRYDTDDGPFAGESGAADAGAMRPPDDGVDVVQRANVGPFDVAVLRSGDADALRTWLTDNGYLIPEEAGAELDHYVELEHYFVALRLQKDRDTGEIQPIVLRSSNDEPCIPIRLTRIAATPDMPVRAYFLAEQRARPMNYMLVNPDFDRFELYTGELSYTELVNTTVDDAGGHAFVTDYAGDVPALSLELDSIEDLRDEDDPAAFLQALQSRGFNGDSQLLGILMRHLPPPEGYEAQTFYNCLTQGWCRDPEVDAHLEAIGFAPSDLVDDLNEAIVEPRTEAQTMLESRSTLTRLFTTLSPDEMDEDPMFVLSDELEREFSNVHEATTRVECGPEYFYWTAPRTLELPSGRSRVLDEGVAYYGSDDEYCEDRYGGDFHPGMPTERLREVARTRGTSPGGGGLCSVTAGTSSSRAALGGLSLLGLALLGFVWRRRRDRA